MGLLDRKKTLVEIEDESDREDVEISLAKKRLIKKEIEARGASLSAFKGSDGKTVWARAVNWIKSH